MNAERLYRAIDKALNINGLNLYGIWDRIAYGTKIHNCEKLLESNKWLDLPDIILDYAKEEHCESVDQEMVQ